MWYRFVGSVKKYWDFVEEIYSKKLVAGNFWDFWQLRFGKLRQKLLATLLGCVYSYSRLFANIPSLVSFCFRYTNTFDPPNCWQQQHRCICDSVGNQLSFSQSIISGAEILVLVCVFSFSVIDSYCAIYARIVLLYSVKNAFFSRHTVMICFFLSSS